MRLNELKPGAGSKTRAKRVGRGKGSGLGKTAGRGVKGQKSRAGGGVKPGFEGGQMPLQRRLPKFGFKSRKSEFYAEVRLSELGKIKSGETVDLQALKSAHIVNRRIKVAKLILSGSIDKPVTVSGLRVTRGARAAIEAAGGKVLEAEKSPASDSSSEQVDPKPGQESASED